MHHHHSRDKRGVTRSQGFTPLENAPRFVAKVGRRVTPRASSLTGFTLIELLVVITIIALLASVMLVVLNVARARARDARRLADMSEIQKALQFYYDAHNEYPPVTYTDGYNLAGWEVSYRPDFMEYLAPFLSGIPVDPINSGPPTDNGTSPYGAMFNTPRPDGTFFYMYFGNYPSGEFYGCPWKGSFGVIGFRALETGHRASQEQGPLLCEHRHGRP